MPIPNVKIRPAVMPHPIGPIPDTKKVGAMDLKWNGVQVAFPGKATPLESKIKFSGHAMSGGDLKAFMQVKLPANHPGPSHKLQKPITLEVDFRNKETAVNCAKDLAAAIKRHAPGYRAVVSGSTVTIRTNLMLAGPSHR
jgi:hypothetical protein